MREVINKDDFTEKIEKGLGILYTTFFFFLKLGTLGTVVHRECSSSYNSNFWKKDCILHGICPSLARWWSDLCSPKQCGIP